MKPKNLLNVFLKGVLGIFGFSAAVSCAGSEMYGTPHTEYNLKGKVVDSSNPTKGIPGIRLIFGDINVAHSYSRDTVYTSQDGSYAYVSKHLRAVVPGDLPVLLDDVDGSANGSYQSKGTTVVVDQSKDVKHVSWTTLVTKTGVNFEMDEVQVK